ncbi:MAG TPA: ATP-binding protein, partial [Gemmataceae bacterium]|nr:ATP-binding protein [Gemmataceae bacterium]
GAQDYLTKRELSPRALVRAMRHARERRRAEEALRKAEQRLREAEMMEAIGRLAGGVAHDINNGMTAVHCYAGLLLGRFSAKQADEREIVKGISKAADRAALLARQLLAFSRRQMLHPVDLDLNPLVAGLRESLRPLLPEFVELTAELAPGLAPVRADPAQVEQVVKELLLNAADALPGGGRVTLRTGPAELVVEPDDEPGPPRPRPFALLAVSDDGTGMAEDVRAHLFEPFFTTKPMGKGLGLATAYGIIKQSGGHIEVESEPGRGTTVKLYWPQFRAAVPAAAQEPPAPRTEEARETVVLAEDEDSVRRLLRDLLARDGYTVLDAADGPGALRRAEGHAGPIHLLLTDMVMPGMSGLELSRRLAERRPGVRVLYVSGYADELVGQPGISCAAFLHKPFTPAALLRKVREVLGDCDCGPSGARGGAE